MIGTLKQRYDRLCSEKPFQALNEIVYEVLEEEILLFRLRPGTKLVESRIAEELNVSRTVVATAINMLQMHSLVVKEKSKRAWVAEFSLEDYNNLMKVRNSVEAIAAEQMAQHATDEELGELLNLTRRIGVCVDRKNYEGFVKADLKYHTFIVKSSKNPYLLHVYEQLSPRIRQYMLIQATLRIDENSDLKEEHYTMYTAIKKGNPEYAKLSAMLHCSGLFLSEKQISMGLEHALERMQ